MTKLNFLNRALKTNKNLRALLKWMLNQQKTVSPIMMMMKLKTTKRRMSSSRKYH